MATPASLTPTGSNRMIGLDLLRFTAILLVIGRHMELPPDDWQSPLRSVLLAWHENGGLGVELFFVLSGFLVSGLLFSEYIKHGQITVARFYARRAWKIYPAFYFLIGFSYLYQLLVIGSKIKDRNIFSELFFLQSYRRGFWNHTWTLAVEEHFYIALPLLLLLLIRINRGAKNPFRSVPLLVLATSVMVLAGRFVNYWLRAEYDFLTHITPTHLRIDALFFGVLIAYAYHFHAEWFIRIFRPWRHALILAGVAILATPLYLPAPGSVYAITFGFTQTYLADAAILIGVVLCAIPKSLVTSALAAIGTFSYSIYLWHMAVIYWAAPYLRLWNVSWEARTTIYFAAAFVIGILAAKLIELPSLHIRDRWFPSRSTQFAAPIGGPPAISAPLRDAA
jgi:peptidoglycan/LPS O-acetylase OafA/YrhL